jgi:hypothetical protein
MRRIAVIKHPDGRREERAFTHEDVNMAQDAAVLWVAQRYKEGFELVCIEFPEWNAKRKKIAQDRPVISMLDSTEVNKTPRRDN